MRRSVGLWVALFALPGVLACNWLLGNETPDVLFPDAAVASNADATVSDASFSSSGSAGDAQPYPQDGDANEQPRVSHLVFVNGNPWPDGADAGTIPPAASRVFVRREDETEWTERAGPQSYLGSPAVFVAQGRLYVLGGQLSTVAGGESVYPAWRTSFPTFADAWTPAPGFAGHQASHCTARVDALGERTQVDVLCGVPPQLLTSNDDNTIAYRGVIRQDSMDWQRAAYARATASGIVYSTPTAMTGFAVAKDNGGVTWSRDAGFLDRDGRGLPTLAHACGTSFRGRSYVLVATTDSITAYVEDADGSWFEQKSDLLGSGSPDLTLDLACAASERALYLAVSRPGDGGSDPVSKLYRMRANASPDASEAPLSRWEEVSPPHAHAPGSVLITVPL